MYKGLLSVFIVIQKYYNIKLYGLDLCRYIIFIFSIQTLTADIARLHSLAICKRNQNHSAHVDPTFMDSVLWTKETKSTEISRRYNATVVMLCFDRNSVILFQTYVSDIIP